MNNQYKTPRIDGEYINVFRPVGNYYNGSDGNELHTGQWYEDWVPNDHVYTVGPDGHWHIFGITHPLTSAANVHEGEVQLFHAEAAKEVFSGNIRSLSFTDKGTILPPGERPGEIEFIHSPAIARRENRYYMIYGPSPFRLATSTDPRNWTLAGELFSDADGVSRDPQIMFYHDHYLMCYCSGNEVKLRTSTNLLNWGTAQTILTMPETLDPESPFLMFLDGVFYLFVCGWDNIWDHRTVSQAYQHKTWVFAAAAITGFSYSDAIATLDAHAPEIIQSNGQYFISSAEWPARGINIARLIFA